MSLRRNAAIKASETAGASDIFLFFDLQTSAKTIPSTTPIPNCNNSTVNAEEEHKTHGKLGRAVTHLGLLTSCR